jgi:hypothetical protein
MLHLKARDVVAVQRRNQNCRVCQVAGPKECNLDLGRQVHFFFFVVVERFEDILARRRTSSVRWPPPGSRARTDLRINSTCCTCTAESSEFPIATNRSSK